MSEVQTNLDAKLDVKSWAAYPVCSVCVKVVDGFIQIYPHQEYNSLMSELIISELIAAGIYQQICGRLISECDYNQITHKYKFRYRQIPGSLNSEKITINLDDKSPVVVNISYDI